jgi:hypothetical protein
MPAPPPNTHLDRWARKKKATNGHGITGFILIVYASSFPKPVIIFQEFRSAERLSLWNVRIRVP